MSLYRFCSRVFICISFILLLARCANPVSPEGGPKDIKSPEVVSSFPHNYCINFRDKEIRIVFNEFFLIKDQSNQISISPPQKNKPDIKVKAKTLVIDLQDSLAQNTTYSINFGNSIEDLREGNTLKNFRYVFSTGTFLDSLSVDGRIDNAFDNTPQKDVMALLYASTTDTIPIDSLPYHCKATYMAKSDENGQFRFENVRSGPLLLFAIKDQNGNGIFDLPNEKVAFCDSLIHGSYIPVVIKDTAKHDSLAKTSPVPAKDSLKSGKDNRPSYTLRLFEETDSVQKITRAFLPQKEEVALFFRFPLKDPLFRPLNFPKDPSWALEEISPGKDTAYFWINPGLPDSLILEVSDRHKVVDTIRISLLEKNAKKKRDKSEQEPVRRISLSPSIHDGKLNHFRTNPGINFSYPVVKSDFSRILLVSDKDTIHPAAFFTDSIKRILLIKHKWKEDKKYQLIIPDSVFFSYNHLTNDSLVLDFRTQMLRDFGSIAITLKQSDAEQNNIIQLLNEKEDVLEQQFKQGPGKFHFDYLNPGKYKIKCINDKNNNGRWDTGNFRIKLQPEQVYYFPNMIEVRANWDIEETWTLEKTPAK